MEIKHSDPDPHWQLQCDSTPKTIPPTVQECDWQYRRALQSRVNLVTLTSFSPLLFRNDISTQLKCRQPRVANASIMYLGGDVS